MKIISDSYANLKDVAYTMMTMMKHQIIFWDFVSLDFFPSSYRPLLLQASEHKVRITTSDLSTGHQVTAFQ